jgi:hypothetical protein
MSTVNKNIAVEAKLISPSMYISRTFQVLEVRFFFPSIWF